MIDEIVKYATLHSEGIKPNKNYDNLRKLVYKLFEDGRQRDLYPLLKHENPSVRLIAALCLRNVIPKEVEIVMNELCQMHSIVGMNARYTYKEWKEGRLTKLI